MVTYLAALRFAPNVERVLTELQRRRFAALGDDGARFLPALIPLAWVSTCPTAAVLDRYRRSHAVRLPAAPPPNGPPPTSDASTSDDVPPTVIRLDIGSSETRELDRLVEDLTREDKDAVTFLQPAGIYLSWADGSSGASPTPRPATAALWLSLYHIETAPEASPARDGATASPEGSAWWRRARWTEVFHRRLANPTV